MKSHSDLVQYLSGGKNEFNKSNTADSIEIARCIYMRCVYLQDQIDRALPFALTCISKKIDTWESRLGHTVFDGTNGFPSASEHLVSLQERQQDLFEEMDRCLEELGHGCRIMSCIFDATLDSSQAQIDQENREVADLSATFIRHCITDVFD